MALDVKQGKQGIIQSIDIFIKCIKLDQIHYLQELSLMQKRMKLFQFFTGGPVVDLTVLTENLKSISPLNGSKME